MRRAAAVLLLCATTLGCAREDPFARADVAQLRARVNDLEARLRVVELARQASAERPITLTQTWIVRGQPPATSQSSYSSAEACEAARKKVVAEAEKLVAERRREAQADIGEAGVQIVVDADIPMLQASCSS
jgi:hypothetical protein